MESLPTLAPTEHDPHRSTLTDPQEIVLSLLGLISGSLSVLGSSLIVYRVFRIRKSTTPYDRMILGLSVADIIASSTLALSPFFLPRETSTRAWAFGSEATCSMLGFFTQLTIAAIWYNGLLSMYYLLTVRFNVKRKQFEPWERWIHGLSALFFLSTATGGVATDMFHELETTQGCWITEYPQGCEARGEKCDTLLMGFLFGGIPFTIVFVCLPVNNILIFCHVRKVLKLDTRRSAQQGRRIQEVATQGLLYVTTFYLSYSTTFVIRVLTCLNLDGEEEANIYPALVINAWMMPLQGFFNFFIYTRPNYNRVRSAYPRESSWQSLQRACFDSEIPRLGQEGRGAAVDNKNNHSSTPSDIPPVDAPVQASPSRYTDTMDPVTEMIEEPSQSLRDEEKQDSLQTRGVNVWGSWHLPEPLPGQSDWNHSSTATHDM